MIPTKLDIFVNSGSKGKGSTLAWNELFFSEKELTERLAYLDYKRKELNVDIPGLCYFHLNYSLTEVGQCLQDKRLSNVDLDLLAKTPKRIQRPENVEACLKAFSQISTIPEQAVEALRHQMPTDGIRDKPPTEADGDLYHGQVQILENGYWRSTHWTSVASNHAGALKTDGDRPDLWPWLHTPNWRPKPEATPQEKALALLYHAKSYPGDEKSNYEFSPRELDLLIQALKPTENS